MKKRIFPNLVLFLLWITLLAGSAACAYATSKDPESQVGEFYAWFIKNDTDHSYPLKESDIYNYVSHGTVKRLNNEYAYGGPPDGVDYFLKVQDYDSKDWLDHISVHHTIMLGDVAVVPVTLGSNEKVNVLVFLRKQSGIWKITKVDSTRNYE